MPVPDDDVSEAAADVAEPSAALVPPGAVVADTALVEIAPLDSETDTEPEPDADEVVAAEAEATEPVETAVAAMDVTPLTEIAGFWALALDVETAAEEVESIATLVAEFVTEDAAMVAEMEVVEATALEDDETESVDNVAAVAAAVVDDVPDGAPPLLFCGEAVSIVIEHFLTSSTAG